VRQPFKNSIGSSAVQNKEVSPLLQSRQPLPVSPSITDSNDDFVLISDADVAAEQEWKVSLCSNLIARTFF
jgi:hypothetical protein